MLRLTLRTLLAYLDDTLEPAQTKQIGAKVAESDEAKQTIERIKTVTRRRRLTALPVETPDSTTDPNTIAEYLDSTLPSDQLVEVEQTALHNDTMLAEVAACHQILTLVLGEPARVPSTARTRMYQLVKGPEAIPDRAPTAETPVAGVAPPEDAIEESDDEFLGSLLGPRKLFWVLGSLVLVAFLVVAIGFAIPSPPTPATQGYVVVPTAPAPAPKPVPLTPKPVSNTEKKEPIPSNLPEIGPMPRVVTPVELPAVPKRPDEQRDGIGTLDADSEPLMVRKRDTTKWERANAAAPKLHSTDSLMALPGVHSALTTDTGIKVQLWGNMSEFLNVPVNETVATFYVPPVGIDAEFTLHTGRLYLSAPNATKPVVVRVRFLEEVWDLTLADNTTMLALDRLGEPARTEAFALAESPRVLVYFGVLQGMATLRDGPHVMGQLGAGVKFKYDNKGGRVARAPKNDADEAALQDRWTKQIPSTRDANLMSEAVKVMRDLVTKSGSLELDCEAIAKDNSERLPRRVLATYFLAALDNVSSVIDAIEYDTSGVREAAAKAAMQWVAQSPERIDEFSKALGTKASYTEEQRAIILGLLVAGSKPTLDNADKVFAHLKNDKLAVREVAKVYFMQFDPSGPKDHAYDSGAAVEVRSQRANNWLQAWKKREMKNKE